MGGPVGGHSGMSGDTQSLGDRGPSVMWTGRTLVVLARIGACGLVLAGASAVAFEETRQPPSPEPGMFGTFGRWVDETLAGVTSGLGNARGSLDDVAGRAGDTAKDAAETGAKIARIPFTSVVGGRQR